MSLTRDILQEHALAIYNEHIVPRMKPKNKIIYISVAITMSMVYFAQKILRPPKKLRHIRHVSPLSMIWSIIKGETYWDRSYRVYLPLIHVPDNQDGLYLEYGRSGWEVFINDPNLAKDMLLRQDTFPKFDINSGGETTLVTKFLGGPNMGLVNGHAWRAQRRVANPAFHRSSPVKLFGELTVEMFKVMETMDETINFSDMMGRWTLDAIGKAGFGFEFNAIKNKDSPWVHTYNICNEGLRDPFFFLFPSFDQPPLLSLFPKRKEAHQEMDRFINMLQNVIENKRLELKYGNYQNEGLEENEKDLLSLMIEGENRGEGAMTDEELISNLRLFFLAGHETTAGALSFAVHYLAQYPEIQQKAREEAIDILGDELVDVLPNVTETKRMTYINKIMLETLRINGPVPTIIPRNSIHDTYLGSTFIPKGFSINVGIFNMQHSEKLWKNSKEFNPDRFDNEENKHLILAFGYGGRQCIGMNFSLNEQRVMLSMLLRKYTWSTPENSIHKNGVLAYSYLSLNPYNLDICFKKRY